MLMLLRYEFKDKIDFSKFRKQIPFYIGIMKELKLEFNVGSIVLKAVIKSGVAAVHTGTNTTHSVDLSLNDIDMSLFESFKAMNIFDDQHYANFDSASAVLTAEKIEEIVQILFKIDSLKAFI